MAPKKKKSFITKLRSNDKEAVLQLLLITAIIFIVVVFINIYQAKSYEKFAGSNNVILIKGNQTIEDQLAGIAKIMDENGSLKKAPSPAELKKISNLLKNRKENQYINPIVDEVSSTTKY